MIIDPNRPDNNITGGSSEIERIIDLFSRTHEMLVSRLDDFADPQQRSASFSFLAEFIGGNFAAYQEQRRSLHRVYNNISGKLLKVLCSGTTCSLHRAHHTHLDNARQPIC